MKISSIPILLLLLFAQFIYAQPENILSIRIKSSWKGLGTPSSREMIIKQKKGKFSSSGLKIDPERMTELLKALDPPREKLKLAAFGITQEWLNANADKALPNVFSMDTQAEKDLFLRSFRDIQLIEKVFPRLLRGGWLDDFPHFEMEITKRDNTKIVIYSERQNIFMVPWSIASGDETYNNFNPALSLAIASLLPQKFPNKDRIGGEGFVKELADAVCHEILDELEEIDAQIKIGNDLEKLKGRYTTIKNEISFLSSIDVEITDFEAPDRNNTFPNWNATLHRSDLPDNVTIGVSIPFKNGKLTSFDTFLSKIDGVVARTLSVPWLSKYIAENKDAKFQIRFVIDRSFSKRAESSFMQTLKTFGANDLISEIRGDLPDAVFLQVSQGNAWSRWLILPDRRMILWDFEHDNVLKWKAANFDTRYPYDSTRRYSAKAVISPEGNILSR